MDVEKLQRINNLARELMKHGMAGSMDAAVRIAEQKIQGTPEVSNIKKTMSSDMTAQSQIAQSQDNHTPPQQDRIELHKLRSRLDEQAQMIQAMGSKINELISEYNTLKQAVNRVNAIKVPSAPADTQTQIREQHVEKKLPHARSGNYKSDDVSIEKIFYSGTR
ncbi:MAG: hypothetical protein ACE5DM_00165 [Candidatus Nanoarchaeia archaeon]